MPVAHGGKPVGGCWPTTSSDVVMQIKAILRNPAAQREAARGAAARVRHEAALSNLINLFSFEIEIRILEKVFSISMDLRWSPGGTEDATADGRIERSIGVEVPNGGAMRRNG